VQLLKKQMKKVYISPNGLNISIKSLALKNNCQVEYKFERLPTKLKPWYKYAMDFVQVIRQKTPKIIYATKLLKCYMMENDPLNTVELEFDNQEV
jgi:hypothetical protein